MTAGRVRWGADRGVSEVISVVLLVAVTIVLAAMVGTVIMNIVGGGEQDPIASASVEPDAEANAITVTFTEAQSADTRLDVEIYRDGSSVNATKLSDVGATFTFSHDDSTPPAPFSDGAYRVIVTARTDGESAVIDDVETTI